MPLHENPIHTPVSSPPGAKDGGEKDRRSPQAAGAAATAADQGPGPSAVTALTCTSYRPPSARPVIRWPRVPEPTATIVQLASTVL